MRLEFLTVVNVKVMFLWALMLYGVVGRYYRLGEPTTTTYRALEGRGSRFLPNIGNYSPD
jgi:hypothetical protein